MSSLILPRRDFIKGLVGLVAAPAVVKAELLMPVKVWRPPLVWRDGLIACNGVELAIADYPDLFTILGYIHRGCGPKFRLHDHALAPKKIVDAMCFIAPRVTDEWPFWRQAFYFPSQSPHLQEMMAKPRTFTEVETFPNTKTLSPDFKARLEATRAKYAP